MNFLKTSFWASISTGVTMLCGLITTKYVAAMIGPAGMAYVGQFGNSTSMIQLFASAACATGVVKYIAETQDMERRRKIFSNAILLSVVCTFLAALFTLVFSKYLSQLSFHDKSYYDIYVIFAALLIFAVLNALYSSVLNGVQQIKLLAILSVITSICNVAFILLGYQYFGLRGVLCATFISAFCISGVYLWQLKRINILPPLREIIKVDYSIIRLLLGFSAMSIVSGVLAPSMQMFVRSKLMLDSAANAGNWQACTRISDYYLNFVYAVLGMYYLPKLSSLTEKKDLKKEIWSGMARILPAVAFVSLMVWLCREYLIQYLLTEEFRPMLPLLKVQLIFDVIKIGSWMLAYMMWAKAMRYTLMISEIIFALLYVVLSWFFINHFGMIGPIYAFGATYSIYFVTMLVIFRKILFHKS